jgi:hypothetical protein
MKIWHSHDDRPDLAHLRWYDHLRSQPPRRHAAFYPMGQAYRFNSRVDAFILVFCVALGMVVAGWFAQVMFTRTPEEAEFLGRSVDIVAPEVKTRIMVVCGSFFAFIVWHFASRE